MMLMDPSDLAASSYFKPSEYADATALLIEPTVLNEDVRNEFNDQVTYRDEVVARVTVFATPAELAGKRPTVILESTTLTHGAIVSTARRAIGGGFAARIEPYKTKYGNVGQRFGDLDDSVKRLIAEYYEQRKAEIDAAAAEAPPF